MMMAEKDKARTLWLSEDSLVNTSLQGTVEQRVEHSTLGDTLVVGLDILLESDAAMRQSVCVAADASR
jgi:hypothetical protein